MNYKTLKESLKWIAHFFLIVEFLSLMVFLIFPESVRDLAALPGVICGFIFVIALEVYCFSGDYLRAKYKKEGTRLEGYIESAKVSYNSRGTDLYFFRISFEDNGRRQIRETEGYLGDPNRKLRSRKCSIYKWKDKYIEADFDMLIQGEEERNLKIPVSEKKWFSK